MKFIVKLFPEIMVKGPAVRKKMVAQLADNLKRLLVQMEISPQVKRFLDKLEVTCDDAEGARVEDLLCRTPGIEQVLRVRQFRITPPTLDAIGEKVLEVAGPWVAGRTFVVRARRKGQHDFNSQELERWVGGCLNQRSEAAGVDLHNPQVRIELELENNVLSIVEARLRGLGGFPLGSQGEVLSLVSGGFDSTVASYLSIRRGLKTHYLFFNLGGAAHELGVQQVSLYLWRRFAASHRVKFITVPFEAVVEALLTQVSDSYMGVMLKRLMLMAADRIAAEMGIDALVTGESVAQVSSQTLRNLALIDQASERLVLRPLAMMDKPAIIRLADEIGVRAFAENMPEYCGVISRNPVTHGSFRRLAEVARHFDFSVLDQAVADRRVVPVDELVDHINRTAVVEIETTPREDVVIIDIRRPEVAEAHPLPEAAVRIPFYALNRAFEEGTLPPASAYWLYCEQGVLSQLHAQLLRDRGWRNVSVYRPSSSIR